MLWDYAVATYARPGVAVACLGLQERAGADVNLLLTAAWLAGRGCRWGEEEVAALVELCAGWRQHCVLPLREVRRHLSDDAGLAELYRQAKALELAAERRQLQMIEAWLEVRRPTMAASSGDALSANLDVYLHTLNTAADARELKAALAPEGVSGA